MAFMTIFRYEPGKKIVVDRKANDSPETNIENVFTNELTEDESRVFKFIYEHEIVSTKMIALYVKDRIVNYSFSKNLKRYQELGLFDSYYLSTVNDERSINMYTLSKKAAEYIKNKFSLESMIEVLHENIKNNNALFLLKKMALNQFLICSKDVKSYEVFYDKPFDAIIEYNGDPIYYYVKVARFDKTENDSVLKAVQFRNEETDRKALIILGEDTEHIVELERILEASKIEKSEILYQTDIMALKYPEIFQEVELTENTYKVREVVRISQRI